MTWISSALLHDRNCRGEFWGASVFHEKLRDEMGGYWIFMKNCGRGTFPPAGVRGGPSPRPASDPPDRPADPPAASVPQSYCLCADSHLREFVRNERKSM